MFLLLAVAMLVAGSRTAIEAQGETTGALAGQVTDPAREAVSGATIEITSGATGLRRTVRTDASGRFSFPELKPGPYKVEAKAQGFEDQSLGPVIISLGQTQALSLVLRIPAQRTEVEVQSTAPLLNTQNPNTTTTLEAEAMVDLPNPGSGC